MEERVHNKWSKHEEEKPELCPPGSPHGRWVLVRCVSAFDYDIVECDRCGKQLRVGCTFDEEYD